MAKSNGNGHTQRTLVTFLLDRTGSMQAIKKDTIGAFNAYLDGLQADGAGIDFTLLQFDSVSLDKTCVSVPVAKAPKLTDANYQPRAWTPLIDAAYKTIKAVEESIKGKDPKVVICIQTDGEENASTEHSWEDLNALIKEKTALGWQFNFMGASIDAYNQAGKMGIVAASTVSYNAQDPAATRASFMATASNTSNYAQGLVGSTSYSTDQKQASKDAYDPDLNQPKKYTVTSHTTAGQVKPPDLNVTSKPAKREAIVDDFKL